MSSMSRSRRVPAARSSSNSSFAAARVGRKVESREQRSEAVLDREEDVIGGLRVTERVVMLVVAPPDLAEDDDEEDREEEDVLSSSSSGCSLWCSELDAEENDGDDDVTSSESDSASSVDGLRDEARSLSLCEVDSPRCFRVKTSGTCTSSNAFGLFAVEGGP